MKTQAEVEQEIARLEDSCDHLLTGSLATIVENAPRALMQLEVETKLDVLSWVLGHTYKSKLKRKPR
jgi:hypothetical protein